MTNVSVIGLGPMGLVLGELMLKSDRSLTLWNRTPDKASALVRQGASLAGSPAEAIASSPVTLICLYDYQAVDAVLATEGIAAALNGRLVINLGTGSPDDARRVESFVVGHGGRYLDGAIQAAPSQMGQDDTPILFSGPRAGYDEAEPLLRVLGGRLFHLGEDIGGAALMDLSTLSYVYGAFAGFLHGSLIAEKAGIDVGTYGELVNAISPSFGAFFEHEGKVITSGDFRITESPLRISVPAVRRILDSSERLGISTRLPRLLDDWMQRAETSGLANEELAALIKILRAEGAAA